MAALTVEFPQTVWTVEFGGDEIVVAPVTMAPGAPGGGGAVDSVNGQTGVVVLDAGDVGADPAGTAAGLVDDLSGVTNAATARTNLGLGNVDNTSDANKPVSTAQQTALDGKAAASHSHSGADITSGTVSTARLGTGAANATTFLRGDQTWAAVTPGASAINDLTDVDTATDPPATDDVLAWDGSLWTPAALTAADTGAIPESLIDAKGDVIVGTANDTAARLAVGADGQVLTADSTQTAGVKWAAAGGVQDSVPYVSGNYYQLGPPPSSSTTAGSNSAGRLGAHPIYLPAGSYQSVGVWIDSAAVSTWRFGVYPNDPTTMTPCGQALLKDMGTISTNSTGLVSASSTFTIPTSGVYWLAVLCDAYTAAPSVRGLAAGSTAGILPFRGVTAEGFTSNPPYVSPFLWSGGVTTGAMPATFPATFGTNVYRAQNYIPYLIARAS